MAYITHPCIGQGPIVNELNNGLLLAMVSCVVLSAKLLGCVASPHAPLGYLSLITTVCPMVVGLGLVPSWIQPGSVSLLASPSLPHHLRFPLLVAR